MTTIKHLFLHLLLAASWIMTLAACSKDDDPIVAYRQDLAEIATDHNGRVATLILDNADTLAVTNKEAITQTLVPDTAYRVRAVFLKEAQRAEVVSLQTVSANRLLHGAARGEACGNESGCHHGRSHLALWPLSQLAGILQNFWG